MKISVFVAFVLLSCIACTGNRTDNAGSEIDPADQEMVFDRTKWITKEGEDYCIKNSW